MTAEPHTLFFIMFLMAVQVYSCSLFMLFPSHLCVSLPELMFIWWDEPENNWNLLWLCVTQVFFSARAETKREISGYVKNFEEMVWWNYIQISKFTTLCFMFPVQQPNEPPIETDLGCITIKKLLFFFFFPPEEIEAEKDSSQAENCICFHLISATTALIIFYPTTYTG